MIAIIPIAMDAIPILFNFSFQIIVTTIVVIKIMEIFKIGNTIIPGNSAKAQRIKKDAYKFGMPRTTPK